MTGMRGSVMPKASLQSTQWYDQEELPSGRAEPGRSLFGAHMQLTPVSFQAALGDYQKQADDLLAGWKARDEEAIRIAVHRHPKFLNPDIPWLPRNLSKEDVLNTPFDLSDAQLAIAR